MVPMSAAALHYPPIAVRARLSWAALRLPAAVAVTVLLWGSAFVAIRATLPSLGFASLASGRLLLGAATLALLAKPLGVTRPRARQLPLLAVLGATGYAGYQLLLSAGEETVPAGTSALIFAAAPILAAGLAGPVLGEKLGRRGRIGLCVAITGAAITASGQGISGGTGMAGPLLIALAVSLYALWIVLGKRALAGLSSIDVTVWATWFGALFALPFCTGLPHDVAAAPAGAIAGLVLLGVVVTTVPFLLWSYTLRTIGAARARRCCCSSAPRRWSSRGSRS